MTDDLIEGILPWLVPAAIVLASVAILVLLAVRLVRRMRRGRRARNRRDTELARTGADLVELDDAVAELDLEVGLSGALYGSAAPDGLRRARMIAQHGRDDAFQAYRALTSDEIIPAEASRAAVRLRARIERTSEVIAKARQVHGEWMSENVTAHEQLDGVRRRLAELRGRMGDPAPLLDELSRRADPKEWVDAARAAEATREAVAEAERLIDAAATKTADPSQSSLADIAAAERALRRADAEGRTLEESHRLVVQAGQAVADEIAAARSAIRYADATRAVLDPDDAERLAEAVQDATAEIDRIEPGAARQPVTANEEIARVRDRLDIALGDVRTAQQRLRGARSALPGTIAAARGAVARAESAVPDRAAGLDARVRLDAARRELAAARQTHDPVQALDAARRAIRHAEDAKALADHALVD